MTRFFPIQLLLQCAFAMVPLSAVCQTQAADKLAAAVQAADPDQAGQVKAATAPLPGLGMYTGKTVVAIEFRGVSESALDPLPKQLPQQVGQKLDPQKVRQSLRGLYASGLYDGIALRGEAVEGGVKLIYDGRARAFFGTTTVVGVKSDRLTSQLERSAGLDTGTAFSPGEVQKGSAAILQSLETSGYHQAKVTSSQQPDPAHGLINVTYAVTTGEQARIGDVPGRAEVSQSEQAENQQQGDAGHDAKCAARVAHALPEAGPAGGENYAGERDISASCEPHGLWLSGGPRTHRKICRRRGEGFAWQAGVAGACLSGRLGG